MSFMTAQQARQRSDERNTQAIVRRRVGAAIADAADKGAFDVEIDFACQIGWLVNELKASNFAVTYLYINASPTKQKLKITWDHVKEGI